MTEYRDRGEMRAKKKTLTEGKVHKKRKKWVGNVLRIHKYYAWLFE